MEIEKKSKRVCVRFGSVFALLTWKEKSKHPHRADPGTGTTANLGSRWPAIKSSSPEITGMG
jgi:hypothetical protein